MPLKLTARQRESHSPEKQEDAEPDVKRPRLEAAEAVGMELERPYQAFVKSKLRQYLRDNNIHSLIRADHVFTGQGDRITGDHYIYPWRDMKHFPGKGRLTELGWNACYRLLYDPRIKDVAVEINWLRLKDHLIQYEFYPLLGFIFSPHPPPIPGTGRE